MTSRVRGPCTPSTRSSSISLVADGPLIQVSGRPGCQPGDGLGHQPDDLARLDQAQVVVGDRERAPALPRRAVQHDGPGLGHGDRGAGDHAVEGVQLSSGQPVVGHQFSTGNRTGQVQARAGRPPPRAPLGQRGG